jgi:hypothetical protein
MARIALGASAVEKAQRLHLQDLTVGPQQGHKAFTIRTIRPLNKSDSVLGRVARASGF